MDTIAVLEAFCARQGIEYRRDVPLREHCSFKIGGNAAMMAWPGSEDEIAGLLRAAKEASVPLLVMGKGSNLLFSDTGFPGLVVALGNRFAAMRKRGDTALECESGAPLASLCRYALEQGLAGLEFAYGIPGSVGGAVYMNAGAYGGEMKDVLLESRHLDADGAPGSFAGDALALSYRRSAYTDGELVITKAVLRLTPDDPARIRERMEDYMQRRKDKQPLEYPSAGSVFRRPPGAFASALIDECGLKGRRVGGAEVSVKHAGFIVNCGGATCGDVLELIAQIQSEVQRRTGHRLECEIKAV